MMARWVYACDTEDIEEDDIKCVRLDQCAVALYRLRHGFYATQLRCTHQNALLSKGFIFDDVVECPLHQGRFHIPTGKALGAPVSEDLQSFNVRVENGKVYIMVDDA